MRWGNAESGLSIVELIVALGLTAIIVIAAGGGMLGSMRANKINENRAIATELAEDALECALETMSGRANPVAALAGCVPSPQPSGFVVGAPVLVPHPTLADLNTLQVAVSWTGHDAGTIQLNTFLRQ